MKKHLRIHLFLATLIIFIVISASYMSANATDTNSEQMSNITSIQFEPMRVPGHAGGQYHEAIDDVTGETIHWFKYDIENWNYTVTLDNGDVIEHTKDSEQLGFYIQGTYYEPEFSSDQSAENPWYGEEIYEVTATVEGIETSFFFFPLMSEVADIEFEPVYLSKNCGGSYVTEENGEKWYQYHLENWNYTVTFNNGDVIKHTDADPQRGFYYSDTYFDVYFDDPQSADNQWKAGQHQAYGYIGGIGTLCTFDIWDIQIKNIDFEKKNMPKEHFGGEVTEVNEETGKSMTYWRYPIVNDNYTVTLSNGDTVQHTDEDGEGFYYKGRNYPVTFSSDQSASNPWGVGEYEVTATCGTYTTTFPLNIVEHKNLYNPDYEKYYLSGNFAYVIRKREARIIAYFGEEKKVVVPAELDGFKVTWVYYGAFQDNPYIERLIFSEGLTYLVDLSVTSCKNLKYVYFPSTVVLRGDDIGVFIENPQLEEVKISSKNKCMKVVDGTIYTKNMKTLLFHPPASKVEKLVIPEGVEIISSDSCRDNPHLKTVIMPDTVTKIGSCAFAGNINLESINISKNCKFIGESVFRGSKIKKIDIPAITCDIMPGAFYNMSCLKKISVEKDNSLFFSVDGVLYSQGSSSNHLLAYPAAKKDKTYTVLVDTEYIYYAAFMNAENLETIILPEALEKMEGTVFWDCTNLNTIVFCGKINTIGEHAFANNHKVEHVYFLGGFPESMDVIMEELGTYVPKCKLYYPKGNKKFINYINAFDNQKFSWSAVTSAKIKSMKAEYYPDDCEKAGEKHIYRKRPLKQASLEEDGKLVKVCSRCGKEGMSQIIPKIKTVKLSYKKVTYTGKNIPAPKVTVKDRKGKILVEGVDYDLFDLYDKLPVGKYKARVQFRGNYEGYTPVYYVVVPKAPAKVTADLCGYDDVKVSWTKSTGATGYTVYYKKAGAKKFTYLTRTTKTYTKKADNLVDGKKYVFKVIPYFKSGESRYAALTSNTDNVYTLKQVSTPKLSKSGSKIKVKWKNISGETGYQISRSTKKNGTNIVATYKTTKGDTKLIKAKKGKTYYYKVRAYKKVKLNGKTKTIYGPWSKVTRYKR